MPRVLAKLELLAAQVLVQLADGVVQLITGHDGCVPITRKFDEREQAELVAKAERDIERQRSLVQSHSREFHALVSSLLSTR